VQRKGECVRKTRETVISVSLDLDGSGDVTVSTGIPFFDHMLELMFRHALIDLRLEASGDLDVDGHHTVEDTGLAVGSALSDALGDKKNLTRFGAALVPMDECLAEVALDISGRPYLAYKVPLEAEPLGNFDPALAKDFFQGMVNEAEITMHVDLRVSGGVHHSLEAVFKAAGRALKAALSLDPRVGGIPSTKGTL
jgi:imidazoleglycerol-phosphate dehydratase